MAEFFRARAGNSLDRKERQSGRYSSTRHSTGKYKYSTLLYTVQCTMVHVYLSTFATCHDFIHTSQLIKKGQKRANLILNCLKLLIIIHFRYFFPFYNCFLCYCVTKVSPTYVSLKFNHKLYSLYGSTFFSWVGSTTL